MLRPYNTGLSIPSTTCHRPNDQLSPRDTILSLRDKFPAFGDSRSPEYSSTYKEKKKKKKKKKIY